MKAEFACYSYLPTMRQRAGKSAVLERILDIMSYDYNRASRA